MTLPSLPPPSVSRGRAALLQELIVSVTTGSATDPPLALHDRSTADPTVALLDAWATVGDVLGFYLDRIAAEGYVTSAIEPGSILALAGLLGTGPRAGIASTLTLAYTMNADPADPATVLPAGLISQSVPGAGETPQTFETAADLIARPSWNTLAPKTTRPLAVDQSSAAGLTQLVVGGVSTQISPNGRILLELAPATPAAPAPAPLAVRVARAAPDITAMTTTVTLVPWAKQHATAPPPPAAPPSVHAALDTLIEPLTAVPAAPPASATGLGRTAADVYQPGSDVTPRLLAALQPSIAPSLYSAIASTPIGPSAVTAASVMRVKATPFGANVAPRPLTDALGNPAGTEEWAIGETFELEFSLEGSAADAMRRESARGLRADGFLHVLRVSATAGKRTATRLFDRLHADIDLGDLGTVAATVAPGGASATVTYTPDATLALLEAFSFTLHWNEGEGALVISLDEGKPAPSYAWDPQSRESIRVDLGGRRLAIAWASTTADPPALSVTIETPLPLAQRRILFLDTTYDTIVPGSWVVIDLGTVNPTSPADGTDPTTAGPPAQPSFPLAAQVVGASSATHTAYGVTARVTRLELSTEWIGADETLLSYARPLNVWAQPDALDVRQVPLTGPLTGSSIELAGVVAGMDAGRLILLTGTRGDLPGGATVAAGELAMVKAVTLNAGSTATGDSPHSTLALASALTYAYTLDSVTIYANVVAAHQGATTSEALGSGVPSQAPQTFTVAGSPILSDASSTGNGAVSTLHVTVDGVPATAVARADATAPPLAYVVGADAQGQTTVTFPNPLAPGNGNVVATYRTGDGGAGNVRAHQVSQLLSRPLGVKAVDNPLPATGGVGADGPGELQGALTAGLDGLGRLVTVDDYRALAGSWPGVAQATARLAGDRTGESLVVTVAGSQPPQLDRAGTICTGIAAAFAAGGDPALPVVVLPAGLWLIILAATVTYDMTNAWQDVADAVTAQLLTAFGYSAAALGAEVVIGDLAAAAHRAPGVLGFTVTSLVLVPSSADATDLANVIPILLGQPVPTARSFATAAARWSQYAQTPLPDPPPRADQIAYLSAAVPDTVILTGAAR